MYPEEGNAGPADLPPMGRESFKDKVTYHLEGLIPIILIVVIALLLGCYANVLDTIPGVGSVCRAVNLGGSEPARMLVLGTPSQYTMKALNDNRDLVQFQTRSTEALGNNPETVLANLRQYNVVMLDQTQQSNREISRSTAEAIQSYVFGGGKFILVRDSGIRRPGSFDILGWKANFNKTVPVDCPRVGNIDIPSCLKLDPVVGKMYPGAAGYTHPIMRGIEVVPALPGQNQRFDALDQISISGGVEVAYIVADGTNKYYVGIVEAQSLNTGAGKSLYFNYDPGTTPGIFANTLRYLK